MIDKSNSGGKGPRKPFSADSKSREPRKSFSPRQDSGGPRKDFAPRRILEETVPLPAASGGADSASRIAKVMARAGLCSRRDAEQWIVDGRVSVNGVVLTSPALNVSAQDKVVVDGKPLTAAEPTRLFMFHKPRATVTTDRDPEGRPTIFEVLPPGLPRVMTIGRLDINTEGLLLLTNDGGLARQLELPKTGWLRRYRVRAHGETDQAVLDELINGITIEGIHYAGIEATLDRVQGSNLWLTMGLREGKNREIKRVLEHLGLAVTRLIRISFGPFQLLELAEGAVEEVKTRVLKDQLGETLIAEAGCIFAEEAVAPVRPPRSFAPAPREQWDERSSERRPHRTVSREQDFSGEAEPAREKPLGGTRKHVKTLRIQRDVQQRTGPRQTISRDTTQDRNGRAVTVERVVKPSIRLPEEPASRNGRRFAAGNSERPEGETGRPRTVRQSDFKPERSAGDKPFKKPWRKTDGDAYDDRPKTGRSFEKRQLSSRSFAGKSAGPAKEGRSTEGWAKAVPDGKPRSKPSFGKPSFGKPSAGKPRGGGPSSSPRSGGGPAGGSRPPRGQGR